MQPNTILAVLLPALAAAQQQTGLNFYHNTDCTSRGTVFGDPTRIVGDCRMSGAGRLQSFKVVGTYDNLDIDFFSDSFCVDKLNQGLDIANSDGKCQLTGGGAESYRVRNK